jgi:hypothetical protein
MRSRLCVPPLPSGSHLRVWWFFVTVLYKASLSGFTQVTMMSKLISQFPGPRPGSVQPGFSKREPLSEARRVLSANEARSIVSSLSRRRGEALAYRFLGARERLMNDFGAALDIVERPAGGLAVSARYEFQTLDRLLDTDKEDLVRMAGFSLTLSIRPMLELPLSERYEKTGRFIETALDLAPGPDGTTGVWHRRTPVYEMRTERHYTISERPYASAELSRAVRSAEAFYELLDLRLKMPKIAQDVPDNVVPISQPPPRPEMKSGVFEVPDVPKAQVS